MSLLNSLTKVIKSFVRDDAFTLAAALSFYIVTSLAPILLIIIALVSLFDFATVQNLTSQAGQFLGSDVSDTINSLIENASENSGARSLSLGIGVILAAISVSAVMAQMRYSFNKILNIQQESSIKKQIMKRIYLFIFFLFFILVVLVSLAISSFLQVNSKDTLSMAIDQLVSFLIFTILFMLLFKFIPDKKIPLKKIWPPALLTAVLFTAGKYAISFYLGLSTFSSTYGAAGSLIIILLFIYYSSLILFLGLEILDLYD